MAGIKSAVKKAVVFAVYWTITGSFAFVLNYAVTGSERTLRPVLQGELEDTAAEVLSWDAEESAAEKAVAESDVSGMNSGGLDEVSEKPGDTQVKQIALSFDDGPHPVYTEMLLDGLAERNVKASFFVVGKNIIGNEKLISRMYEEGHVIGNHTYDHVKLCEMSDEEACVQVEKTNDLIYEITGEHIEYVRPPFGEWNQGMECSFTMIPVLWDVDPLDWTTKNQEQIVRHVVEQTEDGDIILLHDYYESSVNAALRIVDELQQQGYEFVTIDRIIME